MRIPISVRFVGVVADRLHQEVLDKPLDPSGSNWPSGFRWFFALEVIGLTGISVAFAQIGAGLLRQQAKWRREARTILMSSLLILLSGVLFLKMIPPRSSVAPPPPRFYDVEALSQTAEPPGLDFPIDELGAPAGVLVVEGVEQAEVDLP
jgi:hypothetical protein